MTDVIQGTYADFKLIKTRGVVQFIIEIPIENVDELIGLFGMPDYGAEKWVAIAPLKSGAAPKLTSAKTSYKNKTIGEQAVSRAAILCADPSFQDWVCFSIKMMPAGLNREGQEKFTIEWLREDLAIKSRSEIATNEDVRNGFFEIEGRYREYMRYGDVR